MTLGQICRDFADLSDPVIRLLTTYLRENRVDHGDNQPPADVQEIMNILRGIGEKLRLSRPERSNQPLLTLT